MRTPSLWTGLLRGLCLISVLLGGVLPGKADELSDLKADIAAAKAKAAADIAAIKASYDNTQDQFNAAIASAVAKYEEALKPPSLVFSISSNAASDADPSVIQEEGGKGKILAMLSKPAKTAISVDLTLSGTATAEDYTVSGTTITIPVGALVGSVDLLATSDKLVEDSETVIIDLAVTSGTLIDIKGSPLSFTIVSDDAYPAIALAADKPSFPENGGRVTLTAAMSDSSLEDTTVTLTFAGTAVRGKDYTVSADKFTIAAGDTSGSITLDGVDDDLVEEDRLIEVSLEAAPVSAVTIRKVTLVLTSEDKPVPPPEPTPPPAYPEITSKHPRIYWHSSVRARLLSAPTVWKYVAQIADTDATTRLTDTPLCCAALWLVSKEGGLPAPPLVASGKLMVPSFKYLYTAEQYRDRAIAKSLVMAQTQISLAGNHYATNQLHPLAVLYDWLYNDMTEVQRVTIRATLVESLNAAYTKIRFDPTGKLDASGKPLKIPVQNPNLYWEGYNADSGCGMTVALAVAGETDFDWVRQYYTENWWSIPPPEAKGVGGFYNREFEKNWLVGGGNNEDWGYFGNQLQIRAAKQAWETATGDLKSLDYPWLTRNSLLYLHQSVLLSPSTGKRLRHLPTYGNGNNWLLHGEALWFASGTGSSDPQIAALSAWLLPQVQYAGLPAFDEFFWRCVVGDPRVKAQSPADLGLPLDYFVESTGLYYDRTDWTDAATRVFFGCSEQMYRSTASGNVMIWVKGLPLIADRSGTYAHGYSGPGRAILPMIRVAATGKIVVPLSGDDVPRRVKVASFRRDGNRYTADLAKLYAGTVTRMTRSFEFDRAANVVTIIDECVPKPGYVPMASWPTPLKPMINDSSVTFSNGFAEAEMTWDATPAEVTFRGGETDNLWAEEYDRTLYNVAGTTEWRKLPIDQQILAGGYYTVYVTPSSLDGVFRLVSVIRIK